MKLVVHLNYSALSQSELSNLSCRFPAVVISSGYCDVALASKRFPIKEYPLKNSNFPNSNRAFE